MERQPAAGSAQAPRPADADSPEQAARPAETARPPQQPLYRVDERQWRYADVACERCGALVQVAKFSPQHTSIQWSAESVLTCAEFSARVAAGETSALIAACGSMRGSIDKAVADHRVEVRPP